MRPLPALRRVELPATSKNQSAQRMASVETIEVWSFVIGHSFSDLRGAGSQNGVLHAMDKLFVGGGNRREDTAQLCMPCVALARHKIIRTEPNPTRHRHELIGVEI